MGTDNKGNRIAFGTPTTDYGFMEGEYFAGRTAQTGWQRKASTDKMIPDRVGSEVFCTDFAREASSSWQKK